MGEERGTTWYLLLKYLLDLMILLNLQDMSAVVLPQKKFTTYCVTTVSLNQESVNLPSASPDNGISQAIYDWRRWDALAGPGTRLFISFSSSSE